MSCPPGVTDDPWVPGPSGRKTMNAAILLIILNVSSLTRYAWAPGPAEPSHSSFSSVAEEGTERELGSAWDPNGGALPDNELGSAWDPNG
jgi:hypothetical protein